MIETNKYSDRIAAYLYHDMDQERRLAFERDLERDPDLAFEFKRQSEAIDILKAKVMLEEIEKDPDMAEAERLVEEFYAEKEREEGEEIMKSLPTRILYPLIAVAAMTIGLIFFLDLSKVSGDRLFNRYYSPQEDASFTLRGDEDEVRRDFSEAVRFYLAKDYVVSTRVFAALSAEYPDLQEARFYLALSLIGEEDFTSAAEGLENYLELSDSYMPEAKWYLGLCYLKLERYADAKSIMSELSDAGGVLGNDAAKIVKKLRQIK